MQANRTAELKALLEQRILILDGAMGTMIQRHKLQEADYRGTRFAGHSHDLKGNNDLLLLTRPEVIRGIHAEYLAAGADIIETNTFNSNAVSQADYKLESLVYELNVAGAKLAREVCDEFTAKDPAKPRFVAGVLGPTSRTASISPDVNDPGYRNVTFDALVTDYIEAIRGLTDGGADILLVETVFDTLNAKAALFAIEQFFDASGRRWPVMISGTITDASGRTLSGQTAEAFWNSLRHVQPLSFGLNCALGAKELRQYVEELSRVCDCYVSAHPNAGLPNAFGGYDETADMLADEIESWAKAGIVNIVGCNNPRVVYERAVVDVADELLKNNILLFTNGCASFPLLKLGFCSKEGAAKAGDSLQKFLGGKLPPVWHMGECVDNTRASVVLGGIAQAAGHDIKDMPYGFASPEWSNEKGLDASLAFRLFGINSYHCVEPPVQGSTNVENFLKHDTKETLGSVMTVNVDPKALAKQIVADIEEKRRKLGWD